MAEAEFDIVASDYAAQHARSIRFSGEDVGYFAEYKVADARRMAEREGLTVNRVLDFGAGVGNSLKPLRQAFPDAHISCLDVSERSLDLCREQLSDRISFHAYDGLHMPAAMGSFDFVFTACVFHHIPEELHVALLEQIRRHLSPGGVFMLFEHNPWNPLTRYAVANCPFDENAVLISAPEMRRRLVRAGFNHVNTNYRIFFPGPLAALRPLERSLAWLPIGAQYSLTAS
ncbi:SAM-dependent methyltransferase [Sphingobium sp. TA15]|uniref:SAM-dependent methyltransferase n=1 Tax=Sphingobium indicum (strain DSM 16413 / CCM 7287 / MTCC 6362 / UT26 / NBRC 101211 / UT26S) TaxID=452662 RepID=D4Z5B0_SPHIU|nr:MULTISPECIES: class I SAM-dependent methyltransferase [Sphingobium]WDA38633.1 class I SAM-dependent methyltransferase [Sphingobium sp. YC-XJ3]BAI97792.1 SAM-dependent methyltransferase [Sphingobium indicum UT26S]BDD67187.1 SAM-dependent methyltransferase [Sphingobium sp. TA15]